MQYLTEFSCLLSNGEELYLLANDAEDAAWDALQLAQDQGQFLVDIKPIKGE